MQMPDDRVRAKGGGGSPMATDWVPDIAPARSDQRPPGLGPDRALTDNQGRDNPKALGAVRGSPRPAGSALTLPSPP